LQDWYISFAIKSILVENYTVSKSETSASRQTLGEILENRDKKEAINK
jgi:hypothetical protein